MHTSSNEKKAETYYLLRSDEDRFGSYLIIRQEITLTLNYPQGPSVQIQESITGSCHRAQDAFELLLQQAAEQGQEKNTAMPPVAEEQ